MRPSRTFSHSVEVRSSRDAAWTYWSDVANWATVDPGVEWAHIDGAFVAGTHGQTKPVGGPVTDWTLVEVLAGRRAVIEIVVPGAAVRFEWEFSDGERGGAVLRQAVELAGEEAESYLDAMQSLTDGMPAGMARLAAAIERAATGPPN